MRSQAIVSALTFVSSVSAFWRMPCRSRTGLGRLDPIMNPGEISAHVHAIHGGGNFGFNTTYEDLAAADGCTSCEVTQDKSAYWTPAMYFMYSNGTTVLVDQIGGMLAYYLLYLSNLQPFPEGFRMIAGNDEIRNFTGPFPDTPLSSWPTDPTDQFFLQQRSIGFNCLNYAVDPEPSLYRHQFPTKDYMDANCLDGIRLELAFPSCWNGSLDSADHKSHMAYPSLVKEGNCPSSHPQHVPFLFFETIWNTHAFAGEDGQFLLSYGDPIGTGYHGDFIMGWESSDFLGQAIDTCTNMSGDIQDCPLFDIQSDATAAQCTFQVPDVLSDDNPTGPRSGLPVNVPVQAGPECATEYPVAGASGVATSSMASTSATNSFSLPTLSYTAANPSVTSTAQGGIVVDVISKTSSSTSSSSTSSSSTSSSETAPSSVITAAPSLTSAAASPDIISTSFTTQGNEVIEVVIEEVDVTVTATPSAGWSKHKRHLQKHKNRHFR